MEFNEYIEAIGNVAQESRETSDPAKKAELHSKFWDLAVGAFNDHIAGDFKINGETVTTPKIIRI